MMKKYKITLELVYDKICSNIYAQLLMVEQIHPVKRVGADLMMEQSVVCGLLGYFEFLTPERLKRVLRWQRSIACYGNIENEKNLSTQHGRKTMRKILMKKELSGKIRELGHNWLAKSIRFSSKATKLKGKNRLLQIKMGNVLHLYNFFQQNCDISPHLQRINLTFSLTAVFVRIPKKAMKKCDLEISPAILFSGTVV